MNIKETFKRKVTDLSAVDPFYRATFDISQISRVRNNRQYVEARRRNNRGFGF